MPYGYSFASQTPFGFPMVQPWPGGFQPQPVIPPAPPAPQPQQQAAPAPGGLPFPRVAERFPRVAGLGQKAMDWVDTFSERRPRIANFASNNRNALLNIGMALMTTRPGEGDAVREAFYIGRQQDAEARDRRAEEERQRQEAAMWSGLVTGQQGQGGGTGTFTPSGGLPPVSFEGDSAAFLAQYGPGLRTEGFNQDFSSRLAAATQAYLAENPGAIAPRFTSFNRTNEEQAELYRQYQSGEISLAAPPGQSRHEYGAAADIESGQFLDWMHQNASRFGLSFLSGNAFTNDPGHVQLAGTVTGGGGGRPQSLFNPDEQQIILTMLQTNPEMAQQIIAGRYFAQPEQVEPTDDITEFLYGQQHPEFNEWMAAQDQPLVVNNVGQNGVQYPTPDFGQDYRRNEDGTVWVNPETRQPEIYNVQGGEQAADATRQTEAATAEIQYQQYQAPIILEDIDRAIEMLTHNPALAGWSGGKLLELGVTAAVDLNSLLQTVNSDIAIDRLMQMKAASPTGASGFGALTGPELQLLLSTLGSLDQAQSQTQLLRNLERLRAIYSAMVTKLTAGAPAPVVDGGRFEVAPGVFIERLP